jgi:hypothetical protein
MEGARESHATAPPHFFCGGERRKYKKLKLI